MRTLASSHPSYSEKPGALALGLAPRLCANAGPARRRLLFHFSQYLHTLATFVADLGIGPLQIDDR